MGYGFAVLAGCFFVFNLATCWMGDFATAGFMYVSRFYGFFYAIMVFAIALNGAAAVILLPFALIRKLLQ
jgi:hypothetical protein